MSSMLTTFLLWGFRDSGQNYRPCVAEKDITDSNGVTMAEFFGDAK